MAGKKFNKDQLLQYITSVFFGYGMYGLAHIILAPAFSTVLAMAASYFLFTYCESTTEENKCTITISYPKMIDNGLDKLTQLIGDWLPTENSERSEKGLGCIDSR